MVKNFHRAAASIFPALHCESDGFAPVSNPIRTRAGHQRFVDIDLKTGQTHISRNWIYRSGKGCYLDTPKTRTSIRDVILPSSMLDLLLEYQGWQMG